MRGVWGFSSCEVRGEDGKRGVCAIGQLYPTTPRGSLHFAIPRYLQFPKPGVLLFLGTRPFRHLEHLFLNPLLQNLYLTSYCGSRIPLCGPFPPTHARAWASLPCSRSTRRGVCQASHTHSLPSCPLHLSAPSLPSLPEQLARGLDLNRYINI